MVQNRITTISTIIFILWSLSYILHDLGIISWFNMDLIPLPIVIILYLAIYKGSKKFAGS